MTILRYYLLMMITFLAVVALICGFLYAPLEQAFLANWAFNLVILGALAIGILMLVTWVVSVVVDDVSIVDIVWGLGFVVATWSAYIAAETTTGRGLLVAVLVTVWGLRLTGYLAWSMRVTGYQYLLVDDYPPFAWAPSGYPVAIEVRSVGIWRFQYY